MPYRRLPKTDKARLRSLGQAVEACIQNGIYTNVLPHDLYHRAKNFLERFSREVSIYERSITEQSSKRRNSKYETALKQARMYVSHFVQVLSLSIIRGEIPRSKRSYYGLPTDQDSVPPLVSESALLQCGENIKEGERRRTAEGGVPIYNPTMGRVAVVYDIFKEMYQHQQQLQQRTTEALENIAAMRPEGDAMILNIWNIVEEHFAKLPQEKRLKECAKYGIIYYTRTDRKKKSEKDD